MPHKLFISMKLQVLIVIIFGFISKIKSASIKFGYLYAFNKGSAKEFTNFAAFGEIPPGFTVSELDKMNRQMDKFLSAYYKGLLEPKLAIYKTEPVPVWVATDYHKYQVVLYGDIFDFFQIFRKYMLNESSKRTLWMRVRFYDVPISPMFTRYEQVPIVKFNLKLVRPLFYAIIFFDLTPNQISDLPAAILASDLDSMVSKVKSRWPKNEFKNRSIFMLNAQESSTESPNIDNPEQQLEKCDSNDGIKLDNGNKIVVVQTPTDPKELVEPTALIMPVGIGGEANAPFSSPTSVQANVSFFSNIPIIPIKNNESDLDKLPGNDIALKDRAYTNDSSITAAIITNQSSSNSDQFVGPNTQFATNLDDTDLNLTNESHSDPILNLLANQETVSRTILEKDEIQVSIDVIKSDHEAIITQNLDSKSSTAVGTQVPSDINAIIESSPSNLSDKIKDVSIDDPKDKATESKFVISIEDSIPQDAIQTISTILNNSKAKENEEEISIAGPNLPDLSTLNSVEKQDKIPDALFDEEYIIDPKKSNESSSFGVDKEVVDIELLSTDVENNQSSDDRNIDASNDENESTHSELPDESVFQPEESQVTIVDSKYNNTPYNNIENTSNSTVLAVSSDMSPLNPIEKQKQEKIPNALLDDESTMDSKKSNESAGKEIVDNQLLSNDVKNNQGKEDITIDDLNDDNESTHSLIPGLLDESLVQPEEPQYNIVDSSHYNTTVNIIENTTNSIVDTVPELPDEPFLKTNENDSNQLKSETEFPNNEEFVEETTLNITEANDHDLDDKNHQPELLHEIQLQPLPVIIPSTPPNSNHDDQNRIDDLTSPQPLITNLPDGNLDEMHADQGDNFEDENSDNLIDSSNSSVLSGLSNSQITKNDEEYKSIKSLSTKDSEHDSDLDANTNDHSIDLIDSYQGDEELPPPFIGVPDNSPVSDHRSDNSSADDFNVNVHDSKDKSRCVSEDQYSLSHSSDSKSVGSLHSRGRSRISNQSYSTKDSKEEVDSDTRARRDVHHNDSDSKNEGTCNDIERNRDDIDNKSDEKSFDDDYTEKGDESNRNNIGIDEAIDTGKDENSLMASSKTCSNLCSCCGFKSTIRDRFNIVRSKRVKKFDYESESKTCWSSPCRIF